MELTQLFLQIVGELKSRNPELCLGNAAAAPDKDRILGGSKRQKRRKQHQLLDSLAKEISANISQLKRFLLENRESYLRDSDSLDTDKIDAAANQFIKTCNGLIKRLKAEIQRHNSDVEDKFSAASHFEAVVEILERFLQETCAVYAEQKAVRVNREFERRKMAKLASDVKPETLEDRGHALQQRMELDQDQVDEEEVELSEGERRQLQEENDQLYSELLHVQDAVRQVESKVVKIAELQEIFTEKVLQQKDDIDLISANATNTTENVKDANEELRKAIQNQASARVYILFFLVVMSFSLLFLDWYNE